MSSPLFNSGQALGRQRKIFFKGYWESIVSYDIKSQFLFQASMYGRQRKKTVGWCDELGGWHWYIYTAAAAKLLQSCPTLCDPRDSSPPGFPSLGFSRQEHWSGLPFPSPMHESEKWKWSRSVVSDSQRPHGLQPTRLLHPWDFPGKSTGLGCHCLLWYIHY